MIQLCALDSFISPSLSLVWVGHNDDILNFINPQQNTQFCTSYTLTHLIAKALYTTRGRHWVLCEFVIFF